MTDNSDNSQALEPNEQRAATVQKNTCLTICFVVGIVVQSYLETKPTYLWILLFGWILTSFYFRRGSKSLHLAALAATFLFAGSTRIAVFDRTVERASDELKEHIAHDQEKITAVFTGTITSLPVLAVKPSPAYSPRMFGHSARTQFVIELDSADGQALEERPRCVTYVDGDCTNYLSLSDRLELFGSFSWPQPPLNPGEFDYQRYAKSQGLSGTLNVDGHDKLQIEPCTFRGPGFLLTAIRRDARLAITQNVDPRVSGVALALLLGNRYQLPVHTETAFVATGSMHLLAISGLHVGILFIFLQRLMNMLHVSRTTSLILASSVCLIYLGVTDVRPSVFRATVFLCLFSLSQVRLRQLSFQSLISVTAMIMCVVTPNAVFNLGAWLSFLSVVALALISKLFQPNEEPSDAPPESLGLMDSLKTAGRTIVGRLGFRYAQMLAVLAFTTPIVASTFHVISPIGLLINVVLIFATVLILCFGYCTLIAGILAPVLAPFPGMLFSVTLEALTSVVESASHLRAGHLFVPDLPSWFIPVYYSSLVACVWTRHRSIRRLAAAVITVSIILICLHGPEKIEATRISLLAVGHGNAAVVEFPDNRVILIDAGAMNRSERAAEIICNYLWHRGHSSISSIIISHADMDHYNGVPGVIRRFPVGEILTSRSVLDSDSVEVRALRSEVATHNIPMKIVSAESAEFTDTRVLITSPFDIPHDATDNERSLIVIVESGNHRVAFPGDTEGRVARQVFTRIGKVDVLISPHHGSLAANTETTAALTTPETVIVSARNEDNRQVLEQNYARSQQVLFLSRTGTVNFELEGQPLEFSCFRGKTADQR